MSEDVVVDYEPEDDPVENEVDRRSTPSSHGSPAAEMEEEYEVSAGLSAIDAAAPEIAPSQPKSVDREKACPFLLRIVCHLNHHNNTRDYDRGNIRGTKIDLHTWQDATFKELAYYIREYYPAARDPYSSLSFKIFWQNPRTGYFQSRPVGLMKQGRSMSDCSNGIVVQSNPEPAMESVAESRSEVAKPLAEPSSTAIDHSTLADTQLAAVGFNIGDRLDVAVLSGNTNAIGDNNKDYRRRV